FIGFSSWSLLGPTQSADAPRHPDRKRWLFGFGFLAGILGGAYGMNGPPLVIYATLRRWTPQHFRATLQGYFLPASAIGMLGYWAVGLWTPPVTRFYLTSLPAVVVAIVAGRQAHSRLSPGRFSAAVYIGLAITGGVLLVQAMTVL